MKIKRLYLLGAWLLLGVSASAQITSIQPQPQQVLSQARNLSLPDTYLIVGDTGSQKTLKFVLPLIYSCAMAGESMVIVDPKGELVRKSGEFLERKGYQKVVLNWRKPQESPDRWNPFERVQKAYKRGKRAESANHLNDVLQSLFFARTEKGCLLYTSPSPRD